MHATFLYVCMPAYIYTDASMHTKTYILQCMYAYDKQLQQLRPATRKVPKTLPEISKIAHNALRYQHPGARDLVNILQEKEGEREREIEKERERENDREREEERKRESESERAKAREQERER